MILLTKVNVIVAHPRIMTLDELTTLEKLNNAFYEYANDVSWKETVQRYRINLLVNNLKLQEDLRTGRYRISKTTDFTINERGKKRDIKAPAIRDRVIQKVLCQQIFVPQLSKYLIYDNYASLKNRGTSFARKRLEIMLQKYINEYGDNGYILLIDIENYFGNIDHAILKDMIHEKIHEPKEVMDLIDYTIDTSSDTGKGLNLGAEPPQTLSVFYLHRLDNYIKSVKGVKYYGHYADDMPVISNSKEELKQLLVEIKQQLANVGLKINEKKTHITTLKHGFTYLQIKYNVTDGKIIKRPTHKKIVRERRKLKKYKKKYDEGLMSELDIRNNYKSWRKNIIKDHNACKETIEHMDELYDELFPVREVYHRQTRKELIKQTFYDNKEELKCLKKTILSY